MRLSDYLVTVVGLKMGTRYLTYVVGWTTDAAKAEAAEQAGARRSLYTSSDPRFSGWEIRCNRFDHYVG